MRNLHFNKQHLCRKEILNVWTIMVLFFHSYTVPTGEDPNREWVVYFWVSIFWRFSTNTDSLLSLKWSKLFSGKFQNFELLGFGEIALYCSTEALPGPQFVWLISLLQQARGRSWEFSFELVLAENTGSWKGFQTPYSLISLTSGSWQSWPVTVEGMSKSSKTLKYWNKLDF